MSRIEGRHLRLSTPSNVGLQPTATGEILGTRCSAGPGHSTAVLNGPDFETW